MSQPTEMAEELQISTREEFLTIDQYIKDLHSQQNESRKECMHMETERNEWITQYHDLEKRVC